MNNLGAGGEIWWDDKDSVLQYKTFTIQEQAPYLENVMEKWFSAIQSIISGFVFKTRWRIPSFYLKNLYSCLPLSVALDVDSHVY